MPAMTPVTTTKQLFDQLQQKLDETRRVHEAVSAGKIGELSEFVSLVLGPQVFDPDFNMAQLEEPMTERTGPDDEIKTKEEATIKRIHRASLACSASLETAIDSEVKANMLFEASREFSADHPEHVFPNNDNDHAQSMVRLSDLNEVFEMFKSPHLEVGRSSVQAAVGRGRIVHKRAFKVEIENAIAEREAAAAGEEIPETVFDEELGENIPRPREQHIIRADVLDKAKNDALRCGIDLLDAAAVTLALEVLRLTVMDPKPANLGEDERHFAAVQTSKRTMDLADTFLRNVENSTPKLAQSLDGDGGSTPQQP
ncbi:MAG: hypothetical protein EBQ96_03385 [Proteobacteria bacterium]|nr:hypothetical protein [Pseudomonadota bacterium]